MTDRKEFLEFISISHFLELLHHYQVHDKRQILKRKEKKTMHLDAVERTRFIKHRD